MGKPTGFLEYKREDAKSIAPKERIKNFNEFHVPLSDKKQMLQGARCMACGVPFCQYGKMISGMASGCPLNNLCPEWNDFVYLGDWEEAYERLNKTNPFPEFTARVCPALCEAACTCNLNSGEPVASKANELAIIEHAFADGRVTPKPPKVRTGKTIAVVGSGPAGLAAAELLNRRGHLVTVFERHDRVGGLMRYGIPNMKLEKQILDRRIRIMEDEGVIFKTNTDVGIDIKKDELLKSFDRIVIATGASHPRDLNAPGRDLKGIHFAVDYLSGVTKSLFDSELKDKKYLNPKDKHVIIIGGGDTGNDCVGTSIRLGAKSVTQLEMMPCPPIKRSEDNPWPEWPKILKTDYGQEEAIAVFGGDPRVYQTTVSEFIGDKKGNLKKIKLVKLAPKKDEKTGRMLMQPIEGSEQIVPADLCFIAAGFLGSEKYVTEGFGVETDARSNVKADDESFASSVPHVFACGDARRGQSLVVWAIFEGVQAARAIDKSLMGYSNL